MKKMLGLDEVTITYSSRSLVSDLLRLIRPYKWRFIGATLARLAGDLVWLYPPLALAAIVTFLADYEPGESLALVWIGIFLWIGALAIRASGHFIAKHEGYKIGERIALDASLKTMHHLFRLDMLWHERENSGNKLKRIHNASMAINRIVRLWFDNVIEILVNFIGISIILSTIGTEILTLLAIFVVTFFTISFVLTRRAAAATYIVNKQEEEVQGLLFESVNNVRSVKVMGIAEPLYRMITKSTEDLYGKIRTRIWRFQSRSALLYIWGYGFNIGIASLIIWGISQGKYELGILVLFTGYFGRMWDAVSELSSLIQDFITSKYSIARMQDILNEPITIDDDAGKVAVPAKWKEIEVKNVTFSYGDATVLDNVSFSVKRGEKVGIVGLSGAGKSTLFKLLLKEHEEYEGSIAFDGIPLKRIKRSDYFTHVSAVLQDTEVFNLSLKDNIIITRGEEDEVAFRKALEIAHVNDFLGKLPQGFDTLIGEKGVKLSGGERQRLGIARAVYRQPELLLLDEATSHLDLESEEKIQDSLHAFFQNVTAVVIAHRLTTIREMSTILVMEGGKIIESGSFEELYARKGRFFELWEKQKL